MIFQTKPHVETLEQLGRKNEVCDLQTSQNCIHLKTPFWKTKRPKMQLQRTYWMAGGLLEQFPPEAVLSCPRDAKDNQQMMQRIALIAVCSKCRIKCSSSLSSVGYTIHQDHESHATAIRKNPPSFYASAREIILLHGFLVVKFWSFPAWVCRLCLSEGWSIEPQMRWHKWPVESTNPFSSSIIQPGKLCTNPISSCGDVTKFKDTPHHSTLFI